MNTDQTTSAPGNFTIAPNTWGDKKFKLKNKFGHLNDDDLHFENGKEQEMIGRLCAKLNKSAAEMHALINAL
ncbi:MAG: general stress protein CsbD [Flavobacteriales bacterium]|nr:general stress protein CsbD [Flavobacteriales bacterium]MBK6831277.1 general stress protein CsbD [Flavobacteriales bacterium]MBK9074807.1 general stress protein CsbD [Flavobacteriales bacterium]